MPLYEYRCVCGNRIDQLRALAVRNIPADCECCGAMAARVASAPRLAVVSATTRLAHERNERSAHEPRKVTRTTSHQPCTTHGQPGSHRGRPWMLGHG
jgi:putative FmdB family regulatory protein